MKHAVLAVLVAACGGRASAPAVQPAAAVGLPAARWVPASPAYVFASETFGEGQHGLREAIELVGNIAGFDLRDVSQAVTGILGVDALSADPLAAIGVDLKSSWAVFSDDLSPTIVLRLAAPDQMVAFLDHQRERGLVTQSVIVDGTEVFSASLIGGVKVGWAIAGDWMWIHFTLPFVSEDDKEGARWFASSHGAHRAAWTDDWVWAKAATRAAAGLVGYLGHRTVARLLAALPPAVACGRLVRLAEPGRVAIALEGDGHRFGARIAVEIASTAAVRAMLLPPPSGWDAATAHAGLAAQWNLDAVAARAWLGQNGAPCLALAGDLPARLDEIGARTARAAVLGFDPDAMSGTGAVAFDLASPSFFERQLDRIPLRRAVERQRTFGAHRGAAIAIPFSVTVEYVLEPTLAIAALGDGLLARVVAPGPAKPPPSAVPIAAIDLEPPVLSAAAWEAALHLVADQQLSGTAGPAIKRAVELLLRLRDAHLAVTAESGSMSAAPDAIVLSVSGNRR
ncbi:MAG TPA: hypothetical protein VLM79_24315 [Kofleriaceae bacterium]|nr:hypothetical protein [Kofleriaceae bacterium]